MVFPKTEKAPSSAIYSSVADEYYDSQRHPTCTNFREASAAVLQEYLREWTRNARFSNLVLCEVGAGSSIVAEQLAARSPGDLGNLILIDGAAAMLAYSSAYQAAGARLVVADAALLPLRDASVDYFVISLGDPFNTALTWNEISRCLRRGGKCLFTTPSFEWATAFRSSSAGERPDLAFFELRNGAKVHLPSFVYSAPHQTAIFEEAGLALLQKIEFPANALKSPLSSKLRIAHQTVTSPVTAYLVTKA